MKTMIRLGGAIAVCISLLVTAAVFAEGGFGGGHGGGGSGRFHGGYYGGYRGGWGPGIASGFGWPDSYDNYAPAYYYAPAPVVYSAQLQVVYGLPTVNYEPQRPVQLPTPSVQTQSAQPNNPPPLTVVDIKALAKAGLSDEVILSQIRSSRVVFHLTTAEILDLNTNTVSQPVIDFMINTASQR